MGLELFALTVQQWNIHVLTQKYLFLLASNPPGATAMTSESENDEADMGRLQGTYKALQNVKKSLKIKSSNKEMIIVKSSIQKKGKCCSGYLKKGL